MHARVRTRDVEYVGCTVESPRVGADSRFDGKWVLQTDTDMDAASVPLRYKDLWMVENLFRTLKWDLLHPSIYHSSDAAVRGHVFCGFLATMMLKELLEWTEDVG